MKTLSQAVIRLLLPLLAVIALTVAAPLAAQAQCNTIVVTVEKVFPMADVPFTGLLTLVFPSGAFSQIFPVDHNGSTTYIYDPTLGIPIGGQLDIMGHIILANTVMRIPGPPGFPPCLCLEISFRIDPNGCVYITIRPVCC